MKTVYDVQQLLKRYGTFIYTGDRKGDLELMEMEITELYRNNVLNLSDYQFARIVLRKEKSLLDN
ncbi:YqgQ family protein [Virgibacillus sp. W0181]|uniref:YqgQ family protein n=1 Tax=Virgibacillus sp. W0181 TaxID=3391581 RepID=UPI003F48FD16